MRFKTIFVFLILFCNKLSDSVKPADFILDYFNKKPFMLTLNLCWKYGEITKFMYRDIRSEDPKLMTIFRNNIQPTNIMAYLGRNNYFIFDMDPQCTTSWDILKFINNTLMFRFPLKFMLLTDESTFENNLTNTLKNYSILPSTDMIVAKQFNNSTFELLKPYKIDMNYPIIWEDYGVWNTTAGFQSDINKTELQTRRHDFQGVTMKVVFYIEFNETWNHLEDFRRPRIDTFTKQNYGAIKALMEYCNITMIMVPVNVWGYYNETTQTWNGLIDKVYKREVQIAGSSPYFTAERFTIVDFIKMQNHLEIKFILKKPPLSYMYNVYTLAFQSNVWKAVLITIVLIALAMYLILNWETKKVEQINNRDEFSTSDVSLMMWGAVCQQGNSTDARTATGRILEFFMYLTFFFLYSSYSAYIVVILQSTHTIADYQELYDSSIGAGAMETSYMRVYVARSKNKLQQKIYNKKIGPKGFYSLEVGMDRVQKGFFAFHTEVAGSYDFIARTFTNYDICNLQIMDGFSSYLKGYTSVPKNSPYKEIFKVGLMKIDEYGIQKRNYLRYAQPPKCHTGGGSFGSVGIQDMYNALLILATGIGIAVLLMLLECIFYRYKQRIAQKRKRQAW